MEVALNYCCGSMMAMYDCGRGGPRCFWSWSHDNMLLLLGHHSQSVYYDTLRWPNVVQ